MKRSLRWVLSLAAVSLLASPGWSQAREESEDLGPAGRLALETLRSKPRGHVGIQMLNLTSGLRDFFKVDEGVGVLVAEAAPGGPAARAGLQAGDVIVGLDELPIRSSQQLAELVGGRSTGVVNIRYVRDGRAEDVAVDVEQREAIVVKLSPRVMRQRIETASRGGQRITVEQRTDGVASATDLDLVLDELSVFFAGDGMRHKLDQLEQLDLQEMQRRIESLEAEIVALEKKVPSQKPRS